MNTKELTDTDWKNIRNLRKQNYNWQTLAKRYFPNANKSTRGRILENAFKKWVDDYGARYQTFSD